MPIPSTISGCTSLVESLSWTQEVGSSILLTPTIIEAFNMRSWLKPLTVKKMKLTDAAWLAGFFDGEGSLVLSNSGRDGKNAGVITIPNTCYKSLQKCLRITGAGSIITKNMLPKPKSRKQLWVWQIRSQRNVVSTLKQMAPYLITKKEKADRFLSFWEDI